MKQLDKSRMAITSASGVVRLRKGLLSYFSGALTSGILAWLSLGLSQRMITYFGKHPPDFASAIGQSVALALKTLLLGMCFLATFSFAFVGLGLLLVFLRDLLTGSELRNT